MSTRCRLVAACLLIAVTAGCGLNAAGDTADDTSSTTPGSVAAESGPEFGRSHTFSGGLEVTVSTPSVFTPSSSARPAFEQAVSIELTVVNGTEDPYQVSDLAVAASVNGVAAKEVLDATKGYTGLNSERSPVQPGRTSTVLIAFGTGNKPVTASVHVRSGKNERASAEFSGPVDG